MPTEDEEADVDNGVEGGDVFTVVDVVAGVDGVGVGVWRSGEAGSVGVELVPECDVDGVGDGDVSLSLGGALTGEM